MPIAHQHMTNSFKNAKQAETGRWLSGLNCLDEYWQKYNVAMEPSLLQIKKTLFIAKYAISFYRKCLIKYTHKFLNQ